MSKSDSYIYKVRSIKAIALDLIAFVRDRCYRPKVRNAANEDVEKLLWGDRIYSLLKLGWEFARSILSKGSRGSLLDFFQTKIPTVR